MNLQADMFEDFLTSLNIKEVNILAHDLGLTVALELLARQVNLGGLNEKKINVLLVLPLLITCFNSKLTQIS